LCSCATGGERRVAPCRRVVGSSAAFAGLVAVAALSLVSAAAADVPVPAGFAPSARLSAPASFVAGKPASVYCAATMAAYEAADLAAFGSPGGGAAYTYVGESRSFLSTWVCSYLNRWLAGRPVTRYHLAAALVVLTHEAELERGVADESLADCAGLAVMPKVVRQWFPLRGVYSMHGVMGDAWLVHDREPSVYLERCPAR
jgi:hypothetical protein